MGQYQYTDCKVTVSHSTEKCPRENYWIVEFSFLFRCSITINVCVCYYHQNDGLVCNFRKHGLSYVDPSIHDWDQKLIPIHVSQREKCRLLFYVITSDRRSLGSMCEVRDLILKNVYQSGSV